MRRKILLAVLLAGVAGMLAAPGAVGQTPAQDSVTGGGSGTSACGSISVDARSGPSGENPTGQVTCGTFFGGPVSCLNVQGNVALLSVEGTPYGTISVRITDNGSSGDTFEAIPGSGCAQPQPVYVGFQFTGDIVVHDAPPLPTSKAQCQDGGWRNYSDFENQGECVAFVRRGSKP